MYLYDDNRAERIERLEKERKISALRTRIRLFSRKTGSYAQRKLSQYERELRQLEKAL